MDYKALNLIGSSSPHIRTKDGAGHIMGEVLIAMALPLAFAVYNFGPRALATAAVSAAGCCAFEWLYRAALRKDNTLGDLSAAVTGVLIAFVCPVTIPYWILLAGDFFAIVIVKQLFGGVGKIFFVIYAAEEQRQGGLADFAGLQFAGNLRQHGPDVRAGLVRHNGGSPFSRSFSLIGLIGLIRPCGRICQV